MVFGKSPGTLLCYCSHLAKLALHFDQVPTGIDPDQINDYLYLVKVEHNTPSDSNFKFTVPPANLSMLQNGRHKNHRITNQARAAFKVGICRQETSSGQRNPKQTPYQNVVDTKTTEGFVQQQLHCSWYARNEALVVRCCVIRLHRKLLMCL